MSSNLSDRSDEENQRNLERFTPLIYQLKKSGDSSSPTHSMKCDVIGQEPGVYPYPSGEGRISGNGLDDNFEESVEVEIPNQCFKPKRLL